MGSEYLPQHTAAFATVWLGSQRVPHSRPAWRSSAGMARSSFLCPEAVIACFLLRNPLHLPIFHLKLVLSFQYL